MNLLLDTHALLWYAGGSKRLSTAAREAIESEDNFKWVSLASVWEMAIKISAGKLQVDEPLEEFVSTQVAPTGFGLLPLRLAHVVGVVSLPFHHRDPFDRLMASQCLSEGLSLVSTDIVFEKYGVERLW